MKNSIKNLESYKVPNKLHGGVNLYLLSNLFEINDYLTGFEFHSYSNYVNLRIDVKSVNLTIHPSSVVDWQNERTYYTFYINVTRGYNKIFLPSSYIVLKNWFIAIINPPKIFYFDSTLSSNYYDYYLEDHGSLDSFKNHYHSISGRILFNPLLKEEYYFCNLNLKYLFLKSGYFIYNIKSMNHSATIESKTLHIKQCKFFF